MGVNPCLPKEPTNPKDNTDVPKRVEHVEMQERSGKDVKTETEKAAEKVEQSNQTRKENAAEQINQSNEKKDIADGIAVSVISPEGEEKKQLLSKSSEDL